MSISHRIGMSNHLMFESFERLKKHMRTLGYTDQESTRGAIALTFALSGEYTREQAWVDTNEILSLTALKLALSNKLTDEQGWDIADAIPGRTPPTTDLRGNQ